MRDKLCKFCFTTPAFTADFAGVKGLEACIACLDEWEELRHAASSIRRIGWTSPTGAQTADVASLFAYRGIVRKHIIAAKVRGDHTAVSRLIAVWNAALQSLPDLSRFSAVMPCPSSLWSRLRGRMDLAWMLAEHTSRQFGLRLLRPPRRLYWRLTKRAMMDRKTERSVDNLLINLWVECPDSALNPDFRHQCLLIDDVVTTGATLKRCLEAAAIDSAYHFSVLTLARARDATR